MSYSSVRHSLPVTGSAFLSEIQTPADFIKTKKLYIEVNEREQTMMIKTEKTKGNRVYTDPRVNMLGERVERVWEDPLLNPRQTYR
jgi:hypothetical protein